MSTLQTSARWAYATPFLHGGLDTLKEPEHRIALAAGLGVPKPEIAARVNAAAMVLGGLAIATGKHDRLGASVLAISLVPTTLAAHSFWKAPPEMRKREFLNFAKNVGLLGGALMIAAGANDKES